MEPWLLIFLIILVLALLPVLQLLATAILWMVVLLGALLCAAFLWALYKIWRFFT